MSKEKDFYMRELMERDRELSSLMLLLMKKKDQLQAIWFLLDGIEESNSSESIENLKKTVRQFINEDERIESFFSYFNKTQPGFIAKIEQIAKLSLTEKKQCTCLKMGLDNKQIAILFSIDHQSVKKAHSRLKKKLKIKKGTLREFINSI